MKPKEETKLSSGIGKPEQFVSGQEVDNSRKGFGQRVAHAILHPIDAWKQLRYGENQGTTTPTVSNLDGETQKIILEDLKSGKEEAAMSEWEKLSEKGKSKYAPVVVQQMVTSFLESDKKSETGSIAETITERKNALDAFRQKMRDQLKDRRELEYEYHSIQEQMERDFCSKSPAFLWHQPKEILKVFGTFSADEQEKILNLQSDDTTEQWSKMLTDPHAHAIVKTRIAYPINNYDHNRDRDSVLKISERFTPEEQGKAWRKAGEPPRNDWDAIYTYLVIGHLPQSTNEQIRSLSLNQIQQITAIIIGYGEEKIAELWNEENILDFHETGNSWTDDQKLIDFVKKLSPTLKKHLPESPGNGYAHESPTRPGKKIWSNTGIQRFKECIGAFMQTIQLIPEEKREDVFAVLAPSKYSTSTYNMERLSAPETSRLLKYIQVTNQKDRLELATIMALKVYFSEERWSKVRSGIDCFKDLGVLEKTKAEPNWMKVFERAGQPEHAKTNRFVKACLEKDEQYVTTLPRGDIVTSKRSAEDVLHIYDFAEKTAENFSKDYNETAEYCGLDENSRHIIPAWITGEIQSGAAEFFDTVVIEGDMTNHQNMDKFGKADRFQKLTLEQKRRWLFFRKNINYFEYVDERQPERQYEIVTSELGERLEEFINKTGLNGHYLDATEKMASRQDCVGLFYYTGRGSSRRHKEIEMVDRLIALYDAGLSPHFYLQSHDKEMVLSMECSDNGGPGAGTKLFDWDVGKFVRIANRAIEIYPDLTLKDILQLDHSGSEEVLERRIRISALQQCKWRLAYTHLEQQEETPEEINKMTSRMNFCKALGLSTKNDVLFDRVKHLSDEAWEKFSKHTKILKCYLEGASWCQSAVLSLPDEILTDPKLWQNHFPVEILSNLVSLKKALKIAGRLEKNQLKPLDKSEKWTELITAYDTAPWLFEDEALSAFGEKISLLPRAASYDQETWGRLKPLLNEFELTWWNLEELATHAQAGTLPVPAEIIGQLHELLGEKLGWETVESVKKLLGQGREFGTIVAELDGKNRYDNWTLARRKQFGKKIENVAPTLVKNSELSIEQLEKITQLPINTLKNLERMMVVCDVQWSYYFNEDTALLDNWIFLASHRNFETMLTLFGWAGLRVGLFKQKKERLEKFCSGITPAIVEKLKTLPEKLWVNTIDALDFLAYPHADKIITFSQELRSIFGDKFRMSVYDLLIMDMEKDLKNIQHLREMCFLPLNETNLRAFALIATGDLKITIDRLLGMFDDSYKIDFNAAMEQIGHLTPELRKATLEQKGPRNFGWDILKYRGELEEIFTSREDFEKFIQEMYDKNAERFETKDIDIIEILLKKYNDNESKADQLARLVPGFKGDEKDLHELLLKDMPLTIAMTSKNWGRIPSSIKQEKDFWEALRDQKPTVLLERYSECIANIELSGEFVQEICKQGTHLHINLLLDLAEKGIFELSEEQKNLILISYICGNGSLEEWLKTDYKKSFLQQRIGGITAGWAGSDDQKRKLYLSELVKGGVIMTEKETVPVTVPSDVEIKIITMITRLYNGGLSNLTPETEKMLGDRLGKMGKISPENFSGMVMKIATYSIAQIDAEIKDAAEVGINEQNWMSLVMAFISTTADDFNLPKLSKESHEKINELFKRADVKDFCLKQLQDLWSQYMTGQTHDLPFRLSVLAEFVDHCGGAGPMSQFESLSLFIHQVQKGMQRALLEQTKETLIHELKNMENRFQKDHWSNEDRSDYYNISRDVLGAAPALFNDFQALFKTLSPSELKRFITEIYPLFRAYLAFIEQPNQGNAGKKYDKKEFFAIRRTIREFMEKKNFEDLRKKIIGELGERFKGRYGITKIPEQFNDEHIRSLTNATLYMANMTGRTPEKEAILGWYLSLMLNGQWEAFRRGETLEPGEYLLPEKAGGIKEILTKRQEQTPVTAEKLGITAEEMPEFQRLLQQETQAIALGEIETIDTKLGNIIANLEGLKDPDLYAEKIDKDRLKLLLEFGNKKVGATAAKLYQGLKNPERAPALSDEEKTIDGKIKIIMQENELPIMPETLKGYFQDGIKALGLMVNMLHFIDEKKAREKIDQLRKSLQPTEAIVAIFNRIGEDFKPTSGAFAIAQDLDYLDNLINKRSDDLQPEEKALLTEYVNDIRTQVVELQTIYEQLKTKFVNLRSGNAETKNELLRKKMGEINIIINKQGIQQTVTTTITGNLNPIIENIRECLSCMRQGCNNDTNLTFGDSNKFFIYSHTEHQKKGSVADQIAFIGPMIYANGHEELAIVLDRTYGTCTPFILKNHISAIMKKYRILKQRFPQSPLSVFVTDAAISTGGLSRDLLIQDLQAGGNKDTTIEAISAEVDVVKSALGDNYIEFGGEARGTGKRPVSGVVIKI